MKNKAYLILVMDSMDKTRCHWFDKSNDILRKYHDEEFGILNKDDDYLFEILVLVNFQTGLSWEIMLKKEKISELPLMDSMWKR